jgi:hypothetical protein
MPLSITHILKLSSVLVTTIGGTLWIDLTLAGYLLGLGIAFVIIVFNNKYWSKPQTWRLPGLVLAVSIASLLPMSIGPANSFSIDNDVKLYSIFILIPSQPMLFILGPLFESVSSLLNGLHLPNELVRSIYFLTCYMLWVAVAYVVGKRVDRHRAIRAIEEQEFSDAWQRRHRSR